jgi:hypothetical protein
MPQRLPSGSVSHTEHKLNIRGPKFKWKPQKSCILDRVFVTQQAVPMGGKHEEVHSCGQPIWLRRRTPSKTTLG